MNLVPSLFVTSRQEIKTEILNDAKRECFLTTRLSKANLINVKKIYNNFVPVPIN